MDETDWKSMSKHTNPRIANAYQIRLPRTKTNWNIIGNVNSRQSINHPILK
jgi:hypothetical protein